MDYFVTVLTIAGIYLVAVLGLSLLTGFTGLFSFGHAGFMAIGAYAATIMTRAGLNFYIALVLASLIAAAISLILGRFTLNLKGDYFCIVTLGFGESVRLLFDNLQYFGGARGLVAETLTTSLDVLVIAVIGIVLLAFIVYSKQGRSFIAIREEELAAQTIGINTFRSKMVSFAISSVYAAVAGGLLAHYFGYIKPTMFQLFVSQELAIIVIFGGLGSITGSVTGAMLLKTLPELFRAFEKWRLVIYGIVIIAIMIGRPKGLMGGKEITDLFKWIKNKFGGRTGSGAKEAK